jgi:4-aminobutyrate aminotransferase/(S)-3-amino-2-methylpropionate transaminase
MGPRAHLEIGGIRADAPKGSIVLSTAIGSNVIDVDGNRYVDLAQGFGAQLVGHRHKSIERVLGLQASRLWQALGDVYPSDAKIGLMERLVALYPAPAQVVLGQSGADAVSAALKTAALFTGRPGVIAFEGAYHGLSYGPLAACGLRESYRAPFSSQLNPHVSFAPFPASAAELAPCLGRIEARLAEGDVGALLVEPVLGRGGVLAPPEGFLAKLCALGRAHGALVVADEIWTGLGRSGAWLKSFEAGAAPELVCLGKGLGGGLPLSACIGATEVMQAWSREAEVVHTATFAGTPLACATALALLDLLKRDKLVERSAALGARWLAELRAELARSSFVADVRGAGLMLGIELNERLSGGASTLQRALLERGYVTSTGGGARDVLVLTPALNVDEKLLGAFTGALAGTLRLLGG